MQSNDFVGLSISALVGLVIIILAVVLLRGKGAFLIAGFHTMSESEKKSYNTKALCQFIGKILLPVGIFMPIVAVGELYGISWISGAYSVLVFALSVFAVIYCNTGNRFRK